VADEIPERDSKVSHVSTNVSDAPSGGGTKSKRGMVEQIKGMSAGTPIGSAVGILVVGLVVGLGAGYKIEQTRTKNAVKNAKAAKAAKNTPAQGTAATANVRIVGKVGVATPTEITLGGNAPRKFLTNATTIVVKASPGTPADIAAGGKVVWKPKAGQPTQADEVIVLPADAKIGVPVVSATPTSMELKSENGNITVNTSSATVEKVSAAKLTDVSVGAKIVAQARRAGSTITAMEIIVLPSSSRFVA